MFVMPRFYFHIIKEPNISFLSERIFSTLENETFSFCFDRRQQCSDGYQQIFYNRVSFFGNTVFSTKIPVFG